MFGNKKMKESNKEFKDIFLSPWTDTWKDFYYKNQDKIGSFLDDLKRGLDEESVKTIDLFLEKIIYLIPYNRYKKSFLYKISDFFTEKELEEQGEKVDLIKYNFPSDVNIETPVFSNKNGLVFLKEEIVSQINGRDIIDGGAYIGDSALVFSEMNASRIFSFEPVDIMYRKLEETIVLNNLKDKVLPIKLGLSSIEKEDQIFGIDSGASFYTPEKENKQLVKTTTIDSFSKKHSLNVGLIKLDVEGAETEVIEGAIETIKRDKPILLISIYHKPEDFFFIKPLIESLNLGYRFLVRKTSPFRVTSETVLIGYIE